MGDGGASRVDEGGGGGWTRGTVCAGSENISEFEMSDFDKYGINLERVVQSALGI